MESSFAGGTTHGSSLAPTPWGQRPRILWESFASEVGLVQFAFDTHPFRWGQEDAVRKLVHAMPQADPNMLTVSGVARTQVRQCLLLLLDALNPQVIVLGSPGVAMDGRILARVRQANAEETLVGVGKVFEIVLSLLGDANRDVSALVAVLTAPAMRCFLEEDAE